MKKNGTFFRLKIELYIYNSPLFTVLFCLFLHFVHKSRIFFFKLNVVVYLTKYFFV